MNLIENILEFEIKFGLSIKRETYFFQKRNIFFFRIPLLTSTSHCFILWIKIRQLSQEIIIPLRWMIIDDFNLFNGYKNRRLTIKWLNKNRVPANITKEVGDERQK
jgi:hypothetical protein